MCEIEIRRPKIDEQNQIYEFFNLVITHTYQKEGLSELKDELNDEIETKKNS